MQTSEVLKSWGRILAGDMPALSIEITKECPLRCPGCYAFESNHLGDSGGLRQLSDYRGDELVQQILKVVDEAQPLHLSLVGGDPLVRFRELEILLPQLAERGIYVQLVTSAFRPLPPQWAQLPRFHIVVSIDGLQPEHDARRKPATYDRILKNIEGHQVVIHSTITRQIACQPGYLRKFMEFWSPNPNVRKIWFSIFTPQRGAELEEILTAEERNRVIDEMVELRRDFDKLDMPFGMIDAFRRPPQSPAECIFAQTTRVISADLRTEVTPCQFGGDPDCSQCGCIASMGLSALGEHRLPGGIRVGSLFHASLRIGSKVRKLRGIEDPAALVQVQ